MRKAKEPPGDARDDLWIIAELARRMGSDWGWSGAEDAWNELRTLSPMHAGMTYARLDELDGIQWPCYDEDHPGELFLHSRLWEDPVPGHACAVRGGRARPAGRPPRRRLPDPAHDRPPARLVQHGRPDRGLHVAAAARRVARHLPGGRRRATGSSTASASASPRGAAQVEAPIRIDESLRPGLTFMTLHFQDDVATNLLTIDAWDPKSGTAEFKATAIRIEKLPAAEPVA